MGTVVDHVRMVGDRAGARPKAMGIASITKLRIRTPSHNRKVRCDGNFDLGHVKRSTSNLAPAFGGELRRFRLRRFPFLILPPPLPFSTITRVRLVFQISPFTSGWEHGEVASA